MQGRTQDQRRNPSPNSRSPASYPEESIQCKTQENTPRKEYTFLFVKPETVCPNLCRHYSILQKGNTNSLSFTHACTCARAHTHGPSSVGSPALKAAVAPGALAVLSYLVGRGQVNRDSAAAQRICKLISIYSLP